MEKLENSAKAVSDRAMAAVMKKDREAWLDCFAPDGILRDPVGGSPLDPDGAGLRGRENLATFWDRVVAATKSVRFDVREEYSSGHSIAKVATVSLILPTGNTVEYGGVFVYDVEAGRITALNGYFAPPAAFGG